MARAKSWNDAHYVKMRIRQQVEEGDQVWAGVLVRKDDIVMIGTAGVYVRDLGYYPVHPEDMEALRGEGES